MSVKELCTGAVIVIGGVAYTVSEGGLADALSEDIKHIAEMTFEERPAYMAGIVDDFNETFSHFIVQTDNYDYLGLAKFKALAGQGLFEGVAQTEETTDQANIDAVRTQMEAGDFCEQDQMLMFTEKGWSYRFTMKDAQGRRFYTVTCSPDNLNLRGTS